MIPILSPILIQSRKLRELMAKKKWKDAYAVAAELDKAVSDYDIELARQRAFTEFPL